MKKTKTIKLFTAITGVLMSLPVWAADPMDKSDKLEAQKVHKKDISKLEKAQKELKQQEVRDLVSKLLPTLEQHLEMAERIAKSSQGH